MSNPLHIRTCYSCGKEFLGKWEKKYCSPECRRRGFSSAVQRRRSKRLILEKKPQPRKRTEPTMSIADVLRWIDRHYEKTGVLLSYGKAVVKIELGYEGGLCDDNG